jgi:NAD(P)-dependent dehydrogenase (short-subunit alcohol dehydrogenase family)
MVTGASRGIGAAVAERLARAGVRTALVARRLEDVTALCQRLTDAGAVVVLVRCDLSDPFRAAEAVAITAAELGGVDLLVNNAASVDPLGPTVGVSVPQWEASVRLNLISPMATISAALPGMLSRGFGRIINVSTGAAAGSGMLGASAYSASKAGLEMLTLNLAAELADTGVVVAAVRPGRVDTDMQRHLRGQRPDVVGDAIVDRAWSFLRDGELLDPAIPAELIVRMMARGLSGVVISVYDDQGRAVLAGLRYAGDGGLQG